MLEVLRAERKTIGSTNSDFTDVTKTNTECDLIERAKSDPDSFGELYELYYSRILNYTYRRIPDIGVAEEITSNTFFHVLKALPKYRQKTTFRAWIYRIATNEIKMYWRSSKNRREREQDYHIIIDIDRIFFLLHEIESEDEREEKKRLFLKLHESLDAIPEKYRNVLILRYFEELKYDEIARVIGKRVGTVKSLAHRGLKRLRDLLEKREHDATISQPLH